MISSEEYIGEVLRVFHCFILVGKELINHFEIWTEDFKYKLYILYSVYCKGHIVHSGLPTGELDSRDFRPGPILRLMKCLHFYVRFY